MAKVTRVGSKVTIEAPYIRLLIDDLKKIPPRYRSWDPDRKIWTVWDPYTTAAIDIVKSYIPNAELPTVEEEAFFVRWDTLGYKRRAYYSDGTFGEWERDPDEAAKEEQQYKKEKQQERERQDRERRERERQQERDRYRNQSSNTGNPFIRTQPSSDFDVLFVRADAPEAVCRASYKALALSYHPDKSTDPNATRKMQDLNAAWDRVKKTKGWS